MLQGDGIRCERCGEGRETLRAPLVSFSEDPALTLCLGCLTAPERARLRSERLGERLSPRRVPAAS